MPRRLHSDVVVVASHNEGKAREVGDLVVGYGLSTKTARELALPEPLEDGRTFEANAAIKARAAAVHAGLPAIADDSGLVVSALDGAPGVVSARWAGPERDYGAAMRRVHEAVGDADRGAQMVCALALGWPDGHVVTFEGRVDGVLSWPPRGERGFGYEPMFVPEGATRTYGEMTRAEKFRDDPRSRAFVRLSDACFPQKQ